MGLKKTFKKAKKTVKKVVNTVAPIASVIPGPWQVPALAYKSVSAALDGDMIGALANGVGAYGAGGGFSSGGFNSQTLTNPGGMFSSAIPTDYSSLYADGLGGVDVSGGFQYTPSGFDYTGMTPMTGGDYATNYDSLYADGLGGVTGGDYAIPDLSGTDIYGNLPSASSYDPSGGLGLPNGSEYLSVAPSSGNWWDRLSNSAFGGLLASSVTGGDYAIPDSSGTDIYGNLPSASSYDPSGGLGLPNGSEYLSGASSAVGGLPSYGVPNISLPTSTAGRASAITSMPASADAISKVEDSWVLPTSTAGRASAITSMPASADAISNAAAPWYQSLLSNGVTNGLLASALQIGGGALAGNAAVNAAQTSADAQIRAAQIAADAAKFRPVGITTNFGSSNFTKDAQGNVTGAGYTLSPKMLAQQAKLMGVSEQALQQYLGAQGATAPMGDAAQRMMTLGNSYLATTPQKQAAKYMAEQQALLATGRERDVNNMLTGEYNRGTYGLSVGGTSTGMNAANPRLEALFNAQRQQDLGLASQATQGGMDYAKFGGALTGAGGDMLKSMYGVQSAAYDPYKAALGGATQVEGLGQNALTLGMDMGSTVTAANARSGSLLANGMTNAATTMQPANAYSPWGAMLSGAGTQLQNYGAPQQTPMFNPYTGVRL